MAKNRKPITKVEKYPYPTRFGSHKSMVIEEHEDGWVTCEDEFGTYKTTVDRLDNGLGDPRRWSHPERLKKLFQSEKKKDAK